MSELRCACYFGATVTGRGRVGEYLGVEEPGEELVDEALEEVLPVTVPPRRRGTGGPVGAPTLWNGKPPIAYTDVERGEALDEVMRGMADGKTVSAMSREMGIPGGTVRSWLADDPPRLERYRRMKALLGMALADKALEVAMDTTSGSFQPDRLKVETLRWLASKVNPEEFGDRTVQEQTGEVTLKIQVIEEHVPVREALSRPSTMQVSARTDVPDAEVVDITPSADQPVSDKEQAGKTPGRASRTRQGAKSRKNTTQ